MRIIDAHMHLGLSGMDAEEIVRAMDRKGIGTSWILTWEEFNPPLAVLHQDLTVEQVLEAHDRYPDRFIPFYAPDPEADNLPEMFEKQLKLGIKGCGELKVSRKWDDPLLDPYLEQVEKHLLPLVFHMENPRMHYLQEKEGFFQWILERLMNDKYNGVSRYYLQKFAERTGILKGKIRRNLVPFPGILYDFSALEERISRYPGIRFVGHGPDFWNHIGSSRHPRYIHQKGPIGEFGIIDRLLERYENLFCDISGTSGYIALKRDPARSRIFLQKHVSKILYGTDNTRLPLLELLQSMKLEHKQMEMILHGNALKVLG